MVNKATQVTTNEVRISYEHLTQPYANQPGAEPKYSVTLLLPKADMATKMAFDTAIAAAKQEGVTGKWGGVMPPVLAIPLYDGDGVRPNGEPFGPECKGHWVMTASSKQKPEVVDGNLQPVIQASEIYSGIYARVNVNFFPYFQAGKKGIGCGLGPVQKTRDGEPLGSRVSAAEAFGAPAYPAGAYPAQPPVYPQQQYPQTGLPWSPPAAQPSIDPITGRPVVGNIYGV